MRKIASLLTLLVVFPVASVYSSTQELDALVESIRQEALQEASYDQERIERFLSERDAQTQLLNDARQRLLPGISSLPVGQGRALSSIP